MAKTFKPAVLTGNDLLTGAAVWWTGAGWSERFEDARVAETPEQAAIFEALAAAPLVQSAVVGPVLAEVMRDGAAWRPATRREAIRAAGCPTLPCAADAPREIERAA